ncbi:Protein of unknown function [Gryllus bimaculatus]|nr:Protein of unknown function [Gryllus bimaculatus]
MVNACVYLASGHPSQEAVDTTLGERRGEERRCNLSPGKLHATSATGLPAARPGGRIAVDGRRARAGSDGRHTSHALDSPTPAADGACVAGGGGAERDRFYEEEKSPQPPPRATSIAPPAASASSAWQVAGGAGAGRRQSPARPRADATGSGRARRLPGAGTRRAGANQRPSPGPAAARRPPADPSRPPPPPPPPGHLAAALAQSTRAKAADAQCSAAPAAGQAWPRCPAWRWSERPSGSTRRAPPRARPAPATNLYSAFLSAGINVLVPPVAFLEYDWRAKHPHEKQSGRVHGAASFNETSPALQPFFRVLFPAG